MKRNNKTRPFTSGWTIAKPQECLAFDAPAIPEIKIAPRAFLLKLNGTLPDTPPAINTLRLLGTDKTASQKVWVTFDDQWLSVAFQVTHPKPDFPGAKSIIHDGNVSDGDSVEVFLDPGTNGTTYLFYIVKARGQKYDILLDCATGKRQPVKRDFQARAAAKITATGWNVEFTIPLSAITHGAALRGNFCVNIATPALDAEGAWLESRYEHLSWAWMARSYHEPERFGVLNFNAL